MAATAAAHFVMVFLMTPTPVHLAAHHHGLGLVGLAASAHLAGMYAPAPLTGWLVDRWGRVRVVDLGAALLCAAGGIAIVAPPSAPAVVVASVALLGVGWNLAFVAGTALLAGGAELRHAARHRRANRPAHRSTPARPRPRGRRGHPAGPSPSRS